MGRQSVFTSNVRGGGWWEDTTVSDGKYRSQRGRFTVLTRRVRGETGPGRPVPVPVVSDSPLGERSGKVRRVPGPKGSLCGPSPPVRSVMVLSGFKHKGRVRGWKVGEWIGPSVPVGTLLRPRGSPGKDSSERDPPTVRLFPPRTAVFGMDD